MDDQRPENIPPGLDHLIQLNIAYRVFICPHNKCCKAVEPGAFSEHLRVQHQTPLRDRERVQEYIKRVNWDYDFSTIQLPEPGSRPQPIIPVIDGGQCQACPFKSSSRKCIKVHGNKKHKKQRVSDDELFRKVRLQSWFQDHRQRYWVVDESENADAGIRDEEESPCKLGVRDEEGVVDASTDVENDEVEEVARADVNEVVEVVVDEGVSDNKVGETVVNDEEVFSAFDDSGDEDYRESSEDVGEDAEGGSSQVELNRSDDEEYGVADDDDEEGLSDGSVDKGDDDGFQSIADDDEEVIAIRPVESRGSGKRKMQSEVENSGVVVIDSDDDTCRDLRPELRGSAKRPKKIRWFDDGGVVMASSQDGVVRSSGPDDGLIPPSSPPDFGLMIGRVDDRLRLPESPNRVVNDDDEDDVPFQPEVGQSRLDQLRKRLEKWCRTCPACYLAGDFEGETHHISDCWRRDTVELIDHSVVMQQHIEEFGGFRGKGGCLRCGVPRAICQRWQAKAGGGWEEVLEEQCQYTLIPAVVTMMMHGSHEGWAVVGDWMDRGGVMQNRQVEVFEWFRREIWWDDIGVEVAQMVQVFHMLVNKNKGVGKA
jgi:hypothetical protein